MSRALWAARGRLGRVGTPFHYFLTTPSTNDVAATLAEQGLDGAVVAADTQTAGRGRRGHEWFSPPGAGLYVSVVLVPASSAVDGLRATTLVTLAVGVALADAVERATGLRPEIKWPNDLYLGGRKLAGILAEAIAPGRVVVGYGINVGAMAYPPELADRATSLETELGRVVDRTVLLVESLVAVGERYDDLLAGRFDAILDAWRAGAPRSNGARVSWTTPAGLVSGVTAGIDEQGALLVRIGDRLERIVGGEVFWT